MTAALPPVFDSGDPLDRLLTRVNDERGGRANADGPAALEQLVDELFGAGYRLAAYGTLRPGGPNHHELDGLEGRWLDGQVGGRLNETGWGAVVGFPAIRLDPAGDLVPVKLLVSRRLPDH